MLGQGDEQNRNIPSLVTSLPFTDIVHIDAGHSYAAAVREYQLSTISHHNDKINDKSPVKYQYYENFLIFQHLGYHKRFISFK